MLSKLRIVVSELSRGVSVIVAPRGTGTTVSFSIPGRVAIALLAVLVLLVAALAFTGYVYIRLTAMTVEIGRLQRENATLRSQTDKIEEIRTQLAEIESMRRKIEAWAGVPAPEWAGGEETEAGDGEGAYVYVPMWPRRYSYDIMKNVYGFRSESLAEMVVPASGWVSRWFIEGADGESAHPGVDIVAATGTPVRCALSGEVTLAGWDDIYGKVVRVQHNDSMTTVYGHNDEVLVEKGDRVETGEVIARVGNTGRSTAPHLHFEVLKNGIAEDPELYVNLGHNRSLGN